MIIIKIDPERAVDINLYLGLIFPIKSSNKPIIKAGKDDIIMAVHKFWYSSSIKVAKTSVIKRDMPPSLGVGTEWNFWTPSVLSINLLSNRLFIIIIKLVNKKEIPVIINKLNILVICIEFVILKNLSEC